MLSQRYRRAVTPSACINALNPLIDTAEGRRFLPKQEGETTSVLMELFDWVTIAPLLCVSTTRTKNMTYQALKPHGTRLNKGRALWTLRQLCARRGTLPELYVLPIEFKPASPHHAARGFVDVCHSAFSSFGVQPGY